MVNNMLTIGFNFVKDELNKLFSEINEIIRKVENLPGVIVAKGFDGETTTTITVEDKLVKIEFEVLVDNNGFVTIETKHDCNKESSLNEIFGDCVYLHNAHLSMISFLTGDEKAKYTSHIILRNEGKEIVDFIGDSVVWCGEHTLISDKKDKDLLYYKHLIPQGYLCMYNVDNEIGKKMFAYITDFT